VFLIKSVLRIPWLERVEELQNEELYNLSALPSSIIINKSKRK
jgi:hypothetical protein